MNHSIKRNLILLAAVCFFFSCKKKFDEFYERPATLEPPIYQQLQQRGNFTRFLSLIDKAGYKQTLGAAGYWTIFAPTDSAFNADADFKAYLSGRNISSVEAIDSATAQGVIQYLLVYNGFERDRIDDYQSNLGWVENAAFKRRTAYYTGFYKDTTPAAQAVMAVPSNRNNSGQTNSFYVPADNNNKYIPIFTSNFFAGRGLSATDYTYFYPNSTFSGFNVAQARITTQNLAAENGVIHVIDRVVTPLFSLDQYLRTRPEYSEFRKLLERFMVQFVQSPDATRRYQVLTGKPDNVFVKVYSNLLAFALNSENHFKLQDNDAQKDGWTLFAPTNETLLAYIDRILSEGYGQVSNLPLPVIADLLNAHMWQSTVWPTKFNSTFNFLGEPARLSATNDVVDRRVLSNGFFYGTTKVNEPNVFSSVYGKAYLNPKFTLMTRLLNQDLQSVITNTNAKFTVFMIPDEVLNAQGFNFNTANNLWTLNGTGADSNRLNLLRILATSVVETPNGELDQIGTPGFSGTIGTYGGEYIRYDGNRIITSGTQDRNLSVTIDSIKTTRNGKVVYLNNLLYFSYQPVGFHLEKLGTATTSDFNFFWNYLRTSSAYDAVARTITGIAVGSFYTVFVPSNNAIREAIKAGLLPGTVSGSTVTPTFNPTAPADRLKIEKFIQYHVLDKRSVIPDRKDVGAYPTLLKNDNGDPIYVTIQYPAGTFQLSDAGGRKANLIMSQSNNLSNRTTIHLIDNYLKYN